MSSNLTGPMVENIVKSLPTQLETGEISALILTLVDLYMKDSPAAAVNVLLTSTILYAKSCEVSDYAISRILKEASKTVLTKQQKVH